MAIETEEDSTFTTVHEIFPGIHLMYHQVHCQTYRFDGQMTGKILEINHCREGRMERALEGEFFYLSPGDLSLTLRDGAAHASSFPLNHYHGITLAIDIHKAPVCLSCILDDVNVQPEALGRKFCGDGRCFVLRSKPCLEHIFSELYHVPDSIQKGYYKVKILELLLFLSGMDVQTDQRKECCYPQSQVDLAKGISRYLSDHMENRVTISQLADQFHVSQTQIKNSFKGVYGVSVYSYIRTQKMQEAAISLKRSSCTVLEIAGTYGYDNASKFAKAFHDVIGMTPAQYRSAHVQMP